MTELDPTAHPLIAVHGTSLRALDPLTGALRWQFDARLPIARFALAHERVYALDEQCNLHCLAAATGAVVGSVLIDRVERFGCALVADRERLYVATNRSVVAVDANGQILWRNDTGGSFGARAGLGLPGAVVQPDFYST